MSLTTISPSSRLLLRNLMFRLRLARHCHRRAVKESWPRTMIEHYDGARLEAWNSYQAARKIINEYYL